MNATTTLALLASHDARGTVHERAPATTLAMARGVESSPLSMGLARHETVYGCTSLPISEVQESK